MAVAPIRVLIADDDPHARRLHAEFLSAVPGFQVIGLVDSGEGTVLRASEADLVLLDINLPGYSGVEVLHRLREISGGGPDVYVISSARDRQTVRQAITARIVGFLVKPFTKEAFVQRLSAYRDGWHREEGSPAEANVPLGQGEIDALLATLTRPARHPCAVTEPLQTVLPKGIAESTLAEIRAALDPAHPTTVADIAAATGASRPTVRRYLDHLVRAGEVDLSHRFGKRGRPEVLYRRAAVPG